MAALGRVPGRVVAVVVAVVLLAAAYFVLIRDDTETKTVTAHFPRAVSIYEGSDVRILGVNIGEVTAVVPEGNSVRVEMEYDAKYDVPADAKAVIVTPTLVADRFVQLTPAFEEGDQVMADDADIALPDTGVPVELDRIYASLRDLSEALGPNGVNKDGTLDHVLEAGSNALEGKGALGNEMLTELAAAAQTFGEGAGRCSTRSPSSPSSPPPWPQNDRLVRAFIRDLAGVSSQLVDERTEIQGALASVADAVGTVKTFVHDNRAGAGHRRREAHPGDEDDQLREGQHRRRAADRADRDRQPEPGVQQRRPGRSAPGSASAATSGTPTGSCAPWSSSPALPRVSKDLACELFEQILEPVEGQLPTIPPAAAPASRGATAGSASAADGRRVDEPPARACAGAGRRRSRWSRPAASSTAPTTCRCRARRSTRTTRSRSPPTSPTSSTSYPARRSWSTTSPSARSPTSSGSAGTPGSRCGSATTSMLPDNAIADIRQVSLLGEKYVALEAPADGSGTGRLSDGDDIPLVGHRPQPGGRGGARRPVVPAQRRRCRPARHDHPRAQQRDDGRTERLRHLLGSLEDVVGTLDDAEGRHHQRDGVASTT